MAWFAYQDDHEGGSTGGEEIRKEIDELKDRNTALSEQIREYSQTILEQRKVSGENDIKTDHH